VTARTDALAQRIGYAFSDASLLDAAMAHRSWAAEQQQGSNERLEFLGDAVLGLVVTNHIFREYPELPEGDLAKMRAGVVNANSLAEVAREVDLGAHLLLGKGEHATGGRNKTSILSDALEAVIGAVYLDGGWGAAEELVMSLLGDRIDRSAEGPGGDDYKTRLQELCARRFESLPIYRVTHSGPDHAKEFRAIVTVLGRERGTGEGRSKKAAEQVAAREAWQELVIELEADATVG
jgi:ribonuclease III